MNTLGERLKHLRETNNVKQNDLSEATGISRSNISKIESNSLNPTANAVIAIAQYFNVSIDWLLTGLNAHVSSNTEEISNESTVTDLSNEEVELITVWRDLDSERKTIAKGKLFELRYDQRSSNKKDGVLPKKKVL